MLLECKQKPEKVMNCKQTKINYIEIRIESKCEMEKEVGEYRRK